MVGGLLSGQRSVESLSSAVSLEPESLSLSPESLPSPESSSRGRLPPRNRGGAEAVERPPPHPSLNGFGFFHLCNRATK
jgi:hypothetical protein